MPAVGAGEWGASVEPYSFSSQCFLQAKNEPTGKKVSEKRDGEGKKEKGSNIDRYGDPRLALPPPPVRLPEPQQAQV